MKSIIILLFITFSIHAEEKKATQPLHIEICNGNGAKNYPTLVDESVSNSYGGFNYNVYISHPRIFKTDNAPHLSTPFFSVTEKANELGKEFSLKDDYISLPTHLGGLSWYSTKGYFFAEKKGTLRGFLLENGFDNADDGSAGLIFLHDGKKSSAWHWSYNVKTFTITQAENPKKLMPKALLHRITPILEHAKKEANSWPGP